MCKLSSKFQEEYICVLIDCLTEREESLLNFPEKKLAALLKKLPAALVAVVAIVVVVGKSAFSFPRSITLGSNYQLSVRIQPYQACSSMNLSFDP